MLYRSIYVNFWSDPKIEDECTPEDRYFYLYILTNPHTNLCGCYELGMHSATKELGYNEDTIRRLLDRMENVLHVIRYSKETKEVLVLNWGKYNWTRSSKVARSIVGFSRHIKNDEFRRYILDETLKLSREMKDSDTIVPYVLGEIECINPRPEERKKEAKKEIVSDIDTVCVVTETESVSVTETESVSDTVSDVSIGYAYGMDTVSIPYPKRKNTLLERYQDAATHTHTTPTLDEVRTYCIERGYKMDPEKFFAYYEMRSWEGVDKWQAAVDYWEKNEGKTKTPQKVVENKPVDNRFTRISQRSYSADEMAAIEKGLLTNDRK